MDDVVELVDQFPRNNEMIVPVPNGSNDNNNTVDVDQSKPTFLSNVLHSGNDFLSELHSKLNAALTLIDDDDNDDPDTDSGGDDLQTNELLQGKCDSIIAHDDQKTSRRQPTTNCSWSSTSRKPHRLSLTTTTTSTALKHGRRSTRGHHRSASDTGFVSSAGSVSEAEVETEFNEDRAAWSSTSATRTSASTPAAGFISHESSSFSLDQSASEGSLLSWTSSLSCDDSRNDIDSVATDQCMQFIKNFVEKLFKNNNSITLEEKARFGAFCQTETGRLWFSRYVNTQRVHNKKLDESTFYSLVQYFAIVLFECSEADDYAPAKTLMNMCFTYYHEHAAPGRAPRKEFLYLYLREQLIWQSLRFWNAAFFDAVQCERSHRPIATRTDVEQYSPEEMNDEQAFQENITFGQLGTFTCNMHAFGLSRELCLEFLRKQSTIANLGKDQVQMLKENIERMYRR